VNLPDLCLYLMVVIDQPFGRRGNTLALADCCGERPVSVEQARLVLPEPAVQQTPASRASRRALCRGQAGGVLLKAFCTEQLLADNAIAAPGEIRGMPAAVPGRVIRPRHVHAAAPACVHTKHVILLQTGTGSLRAGVQGKCTLAHIALLLPSAKPAAVCELRGLVAGAGGALQSPA
jgi:hypothetical protein